jgi:hypothetical protein
MSASRDVGVARQCGAKRRRTPAPAAVLRSSARPPALDDWRPRVGPVRTQKAADGTLNLRGGPGLQLVQPRVHADLAAPAALAGPYEQRAAARIQVGLGERERLANAQTGAQRMTIRPRTRRPCRPLPARASP